MILRRIFLLLKEAAESLLEGIMNHDNNLIRAIEEKHDNITKFVSYCLRLLNKYGYPDVKKTCFYYHIIASLDKIADILKYNAREILDYKGKISNATIKIWEQINQSIRGYYNLFYKYDLGIVEQLSKNRDYVKTLIKKEKKDISKEEMALINNMKQILEIILDLTEARMGLEY
ncbi:hypothetical protein JXB41_01045 [Candidatus Woesearchaeota archaeon]|nr:hypothetical protein [Candidatus Woesearchaeota archaeon]